MTFRVTVKVTGNLGREAAATWYEERAVAARSAREARELAFRVHDVVEVIHVTVAV